MGCRPHCTTSCTIILNLVRGIRTTYRCAVQPTTLTNRLTVWVYFLVYHQNLINFCWEGGIRTPVPRREQIYSLPHLTTLPPPNIQKSFYKSKNCSFVCEINLLYDFHMCASGWIRTNVRVTFLIPNLFVGKTLGGFRDASLTTSCFSLLHTKTLIFFSYLYPIINMSMFTCLSDPHITKYTTFFPQI